MKTENTVLHKDGRPISLTFTPGLAGAVAAPGPCLFLMKDGSVHAGDVLWAANVLVLRTSNPAGGLHTVFDIPASQVLGFTSAGPRAL